MPTNLKLAERLREGLAADIWYDAAHHSDHAAAAKIEDAQEAMQEAATLLEMPSGQIVLREDHRHDGYTDYSTDVAAVGNMVIEMGLTVHATEGCYLTFHVGTSEERGDPVEYPISYEQAGMLLAEFGPTAPIPARVDRISPLPLLYVRDADNDHDLLVRAPTVDDALTLWRKHYELEADELPTYIGPVPLDVPGAIDWDTVTTNAVTYKPFPN